MAEYSYEFKKKVVAAYLRGEGGYTFLAKNMELQTKDRFLTGFILIRN